MREALYILKKERKKKLLFLLISMSFSPTLFFLLDNSFHSSVFRVVRRNCFIHLFYASNIDCHDALQMAILVGCVELKKSMDKKYKKQWLKIILLNEFSKMLSFLFLNQSFFSMVTLYFIFMSFKIVIIIITIIFFFPLWKGKENKVWNIWCDSFSKGDNETAGNVKRTQYFVLSIFNYFIINNLIE